MAAGIGIRTPKRAAGTTAHRLTAGGIVLVYAAVGIAWVVTSDAILSRLAPHGADLVVGSVKGIGFIVVTALGLFGLLIARDLALDRGSRELEASEERFRLLAGRSQDVIYRYRVEPERGFEYVSRSAIAMTGYSPEEFLSDDGLSHRLVHPDDIGLLDEMAAGRWPEGLPLEMRWRRRDGTIIWTEHRFSEVRDGHGRRWIEGSVRDITSRREAQLDAATTQARLRALVEASPLAIVSVDREGIVTAWSPAAERILGITAAEVVGRPASAIATDDPGWISQGMAEVLAGEVLSRVPVRYRHRDGHFVDLHLFAGPIRDADGEVTGAVVVAEDLSALRESEGMPARSRSAAGAPSVASAAASTPPAAVPPA